MLLAPSYRAAASDRTRNPTPEDKTAARIFAPVDLVNNISGKLRYGLKRKNLGWSVIDRLSLNQDGDFFFDALKGETERGQVLIAATFLENGLEDILRIVFLLNGVPKGTIGDRLLGEGQRPLLSNFATKTLAAWAFGIIDDRDFRALEAVRGIRNACAHSNFAITLAHEDVRQDMAALDQYVNKGPIAPGFGSFDELCKVFSGVGIILAPPSGLSLERQVFLKAAAILWVELWITRSCCEDDLRAIRSNYSSRELGDIKLIQAARNATSRDS